MNAIVALSLINIALQSGAMIAALTIGRAPGWRRVRIVALLAFTAGLYSLARLLAELLQIPEYTALFTSSNIAVGAVHLSTWVWYLTSDEDGRWRSVPRALRWTLGVVVAVSVLAVVTGVVLQKGQFRTIEVSLLGLSFVKPQLSGIGRLLVLSIGGVMLISIGVLLRQTRRGVPGTRWILAGFAIFAATVFEEILAAAGWIDFLYLAEIGFLALVVPVTAQLLQRFTDDAKRLTDLSMRLSAEVQMVGDDRDAARGAFLAQERFAALGRIASSVGHEINNPLQYLSLNLEELRDQHLVAPSAEAAEALAHTFDATERIRRIVDGMRAYARTTVPHLTPIDPREIVRAALAAARPALGALPAVVEHLDEAPMVLGDEEKLIQAVVNAIGNSAHALERLVGRSPRLEVRTFTAPSGDAAIEVRDNGGGFPDDLLPRLGEPFVTTRATTGGSGLGLFVVRGIVDAHGGSLHLENARGGGALLRILLPAAPERA